MRLDPVHLLLPLFAIAIAASLLLLHSDAEISCRVAQDQLAHGYVSRADQKLTKILSEEPGSRCAKLGMNEVFARRCKNAQAAAAKGLLTQAEKGYRGMLARRSGDTCARQHLASLVTRLCNRADLLAKNKATDAAKRAYTAILAIEPLGDIELCPAKGLAVMTPTTPGQATVIRGADGKDGTDGRPGKDGQTGQDGKDGKDGSDGRPGKDASGVAVTPWPG